MNIEYLWYSIDLILLLEYSSTQFSVLWDQCKNL